MSEQTFPTVDTLTLEQKIAQVLCPFFSTHRLYRENEPVALERFVEEYGIGFVQVGRGNLTKTHRWIERLQSLALGRTGIPILFAADCEQGLPQSFQCGNELPWQMALGAVGSPQKAYELGHQLGLEARALDLDIVFGPCLDVNDNPRNKIIATRSFGSHPQDVTQLSVAYMEGLQAAGVAATLKHFPGHGSTIEDSHLELPQDHSSLQTFQDVHFMPFKGCIHAGALAMMTGHIYAKELDATHISTISEKIMTRVLREQLRFEGVLFTDSLNMAAIHQGRSKKRAAIDSFLAGCDVLLHPSQADRIAHFASFMKDCIERGEITEDGLDQAVSRILTLKEKVLPYQFKHTEEKAAQLFANEKHAEIRLEVARKSLTKLSKEPFEAFRTDEPFTLIVAVDSEKKKDIPKAFQELVRNSSPKSQDLLITQETALLDIALAHQQIVEHNEPIVLCVFSPMMRAKGRSLLSVELKRKLDRLLESLEVDTTVVFGSPYILQQLPGVNQFCAYGPSTPSYQAVLDLLLGLCKATGTLPVSWPSPFISQESSNSWTEHVA